MMVVLLQLDPESRGRFDPQPWSYRTWDSEGDHGEKTMRALIYVFQTLYFHEESFPVSSTAMARRVGLLSSDLRLAKP